MFIQKLEKLEREEGLREEAGMYAVPKVEMDETLKEIRELAAKIRERKAIMRQEARVATHAGRPIMARTTTPKVRDRSVSKLRSEMSRLGVELTDSATVCFVLILNNYHMTIWLVALHCL